MLKKQLEETEKIRELFLSKKFFLLDGDGTLYLWNKPFSCSSAFLNKLIKLKKKFIILSNNDSESKRNRLNFIEKILNIKIKDEELLLPNEIVEDFLKKNKIRSFDGLISDDFKNELVMKSFVYDEKNPQLIIIGFDIDLSYKKIERIINHINNGKKFILTHNDPLCPYKNGKEIPDAGLIVNLVSEATKKEPYKIFGKPYISTIEYIIKKYGYVKNDILIIGDRLNTDIKMANEAGISSIWITNGENPHREIEEYKPTARISSINNLYKIIRDLK